MQSRGSVIFAAGKRVRVVVGAVDSKDEESKVRTSRSIDVSEGKRTVLEDCIVLLC